MVAIDSRFSVGMSVEALDIHSGPSRWRKCFLRQHAPYPRANVDGYYVQWTDMDERKEWESSGGWHSVKTIRPVAQECA